MKTFRFVHTLTMPEAGARRISFRLLGCLALGVCLSAVASPPAQAGYIAVSTNDVYSNDPVHLWDSDNGNAHSLWFPYGGVTSDVTFDSVTGELYALTQGLIKRRNGTAGTDHVGLTGAGGNSGGDIAAFGGVIAVSPDDYSSYPYVQLWDTNNGNTASVWNPYGGAINDMTFDPVTGDLYALTQGGIRRRNPATGGGYDYIGLASANLNLGGDIAVYDGLIAVSPVDGYDYNVRLWDTKHGNSYSVWSPSAGSISDIAFDPVTGELYALTQNGIRRRNAMGGTDYIGLMGAGVNLGGDLAIYAAPAAPDPPPATTAPEPTSLALWGMGLIGLAFGRVRRQRTAQPA